MPSEVPAGLRQVVAERAAYRCEYCQLPQAAALHRHELDHILPRQHGGETLDRNLALACLRCNRYKGPNVGSFVPDTGQHRQPRVGHRPTLACGTGPLALEAHRRSNGCSIDINALALGRAGQAPPLRSAASL
ncbi:MAG: HNH endonuclease [Deltaproteobacteria bacterium]|nr:HNH endonuclease [Deltaproteobacteria bacterium]